MATKSISQLDTAESLALGDLFEIAIPDQNSATGYTSRKTSLTNIANFTQETAANNNLNTTAKTIVGAINEVDSEGVKWSEENYLGAKNLLPCPYDTTISNPRGATFEVLENGGIHISGTVGTTNDGYIYLVNTDFERAMKLNGLIKFGFYGSGTNIDKVYLNGAKRVTSSGTRTSIGGAEEGAGNFVEYNANESNVRYDFEFKLTRNTTFDVTVYPMVMYASIADESYTPPSETNRELTLYKCSMSSIATVENSDIASKAYTIGDYMFHYGKFYKVTAAISQGGAITINTNISETTIGAELKAALTN